MKHGGDILSYKDLYKGEIIDFSSNINPMGRPKGLDIELKRAFNDLEKYPDIKYRNLKKEVSGYLKCDTENIVLGNGSMEIIDSIMVFKDKVTLFYPSFGEYEDRARIHNKKKIKLSLDENFKIEIDKLKNNLEEDSLLIIGNPNNPTGLRIEKEKLLLIYNIALSKNSILVLDEAFFEFSPTDYDSIELFRNYNFENVVIIRAATKFFALPGIRLGYACTSKILAEKLTERQMPWSINSMADTAGKYIFNQQNYINESKEYIANERMYMIDELEKINEIQAFPTQANFILIKLKKFNGEYLLKELIQQGILIRTCTSFLGLDDSFIRVAIKSREDNHRLIEALKSILERE